MRSILSTLFFCLVTIGITKGQPDISKYNVSWKSQSENSWGSMPMGNGDIGANVWIDKAGVLSIIISKTDSYSEIGRLLKIGKIQIRVSPNILDAADFSQELDLKTGMILIKSQKNGHVIQLNCWIDANNPAIHVEGTSNLPFKAEVINQVWRNEIKPLTGNERHSGYGVTFRDEPYMKEVDTILKNKNSLIWCHENKSSIWQTTLDNQNISDFNKQSKDPLLDQHFGAIVGGNNLINKDDTTLKSKTAEKLFSLIVVVKKSQTPDINKWKNEIVSIYQKIQQQKTETTRLAHQNWWKSFWNNHYIIVSSNTEAENTFKVTQGYMLQRYTNACSGRGSLPIKFNGSIFTVDVNENLSSAKKGFDADYREWGGNFWFQNTRLIYWTMLYMGDFSFMKPFFNLYTNALPLAKFRTQKYFKHNGAYFPETMTPWGSYLVDNYGWDRKGKPDGVSDNLYIRYYWQGGLEFCAMLLDYYEFTNDQEFFKKEAMPFIQEILKFYDEHYTRDEKGKLFISPSQSLETFQKGVSNPLPEIAGIKWIILKLNKYNSLINDPAFLACINRLTNDLPDIPIKNQDGKKTILAGSNLGAPENIENPELYAVFPYRHFGVGKKDIEIGIQTFEQRFNKRFNGWHQDGIQAALLGLTDVAKKGVIENFSTKHQGSRFPSFWGPNYDWLPDQDHGSVTVRALQNMLIQTESEKTWLFPAWPVEWDVQFKVHIPGKKTIEGSYSKEKGVKITSKPGDIELKNLLKDINK